MKIKSLAAEARIIRCEERRWRAEPAIRESLRTHRIEDIRHEQRSSLLAYAHIRGRAYADVENSVRSAPSHKRVASLVATFGPPKDRQSVSDEVQRWLTRAGPCGREPGVMILARAGSTPVARTIMAG